jgi:hypothetical protein
MYGSDSELHAEIQGLREGIWAFKQTLRELPRSARDDRDDMWRSIQANQDRIAAIYTELDERREGRLENKAAREEQYAIIEGLKEASIMLRDELGTLDSRDGRERRREIHQTLDSNSLALGKAYDEIRRLKGQR